MTDDYILETFLCREEYHGVDIEESDDDGEVSVNDSDGSIVGYLGDAVVVYCGGNMVIAYMGEINSAGMGTEDAPPCNCDGNFSLNYPAAGSFNYYYYMGTTVTFPEDCRWVNTSVLMYGPPRCGPGGLLLRMVSSASGGDMPQPSDYNDPVIMADFDPKDGAGGGGPGSSTDDFTQNNVVPGMQLYAKQYHWLDANLKSFSCNFEYYTTEDLTGGNIYAINGDPANDKDCTFDVTIEGVLTRCGRSDWVEWEIGDWVFVAKAGTQSGPPTFDSWSETSFHHTAVYDETTYPPVVYPNSTINDEITIEFKNYSNDDEFQVRGTVAGYIGTGDISLDFVANNPGTGGSYFMIKALGWSGAWQMGDKITFKTYDAPPIYTIVPMKIGLDGD